MRVTEQSRDALPERLVAELAAASAAHRPGDQGRRDARSGTPPPARRGAGALDEPEAALLAVVLALNQVRDQDGELTGARAERWQPTRAAVIFAMIPRGPHADFMRTAGSQSATTRARLWLHLAVLRGYRLAGVGRRRPGRSPGRSMASSFHHGDDLRNQ